MCGIAGSVNFKLDLHKLVTDMWHRGPDEQAGYSDDFVQLHHHRLAIQDIALGKQPFHYNHLTVVFNGEIYNHLELRDQFLLKCVTNSDTETLLHLYDKFGEACLNYIDGMFAFSIYDRKQNELFIARDRAGKKPLYYYQKDNQFVFASELKALSRQVSLEVNERHIQQYLRLGYFYKSNTAYKDVFELPAGSCGVFKKKDNSFKVKKWWNIHKFYLDSNKDDLASAMFKTDQYLHLAVKRRVESSDLEVGSFLSGGIDSGLVTAIASKYKQQLKTFTVSFAGSYDEAPLAKLVAERYHTEHHQVEICFDRLSSDIEQILGNYGEPFFDSSAIPSYYVSKAAKENLTVMLNGDGGDELFGGYRRYVPFAHYDFFTSSMGMRFIANQIHKVLPVTNEKKSSYNFINRLFHLASRKSLGVYLSSTIDILEGYEKYLNASPDIFEDIEEDFREITNSQMSGLDKIMNLDFDNILPGDLLVKMDIANMCNSLEGRSPLLSKELLEYVPGLTEKFKIRGTTTKFLLRRVAEKYLPSSLINQPKRGFEIPLKQWVDVQLNEMIRSYLLSPDCYYRQYIELTFVQQLLDRRINIGDEKRAKVLWVLFCLEVWFKGLQKNRGY